MEALVWLCVTVGGWTAAYAVFGAEFMYPLWKRWALAFGGFALVVFGLANHEPRPRKPLTEREKAEMQEYDCWDGRSNSC